MELKNLLSKIPFWIFCISMILFFYTGAMYPVETNYWIVTNGVPIFTIEFLSIFSILMLLVLTNKKAEERLNIEVSGFYSKKTGYLIGLICVFLMASFFFYIYGIWIFGYFLLSHAVKYFAYKKITTMEETNEAINAWGGASVSVILSGLISLFFSGFTQSIFSEQITLMNEYHRQILSNAGATGFASFEFFILWGILYFIMLIFFDWLAPVWEKKTGRPFVRTYR